jgi:hypothetical protein
MQMKNCSSSFAWYVVNVLELMLCDVGALIMNVNYAPCTCLFPLHIVVYNWTLLWVARTVGLFMSFSGILLCNVIIALHIIVIVLCYGK